MTRPSKKRKPKRPAETLPEYLTDRPYLTKGQSKQAQVLRNAANQIYELEETSRVLRQSLDVLTRDKPKPPEPTADVSHDMRRLLADCARKLGFLARDYPGDKETKDIIAEIGGILAARRSNAAGNLKQRIINHVREMPRKLRASDIAIDHDLTRAIADGIVWSLLNSGEVLLAPDSTLYVPCCTNGCKAMDCPNV